MSDICPTFGWRSEPQTWKSADKVSLSLVLSCSLLGELQQEVTQGSPGPLETAVLTAVLTAILTAVLCIIIVLTALGNLLVMVALCKDRHLR